MYCILICDDDRDIVSALDIYLTSEGYQTLHAYDGLEAIRMVEQNDVDLILMDVMMPNLDGIRPPQSCVRARTYLSFFLQPKVRTATRYWALTSGPTTM